MVREPDGPITVYVEFLSPDEISSDIVVNITLSTENDTAFGKRGVKSMSNIHTLHIQN